MRWTRALSILLLSTQLAWVAVPAVCRLQPAERCHESGPARHHNPANPSMPVPANCSMPLACGPTTPAVVDRAPIVSLPTPRAEVSVADAARLIPAEPSAPLPPPPQA